MNVATQLSRDAGTPNASQTGIMSLQILSNSSWGNKFGISPEFKMELMSSSLRRTMPSRQLSHETCRRHLHDDVTFKVNFNTESLTSTLRRPAYP